MVTKKPTAKKSTKALADKKSSIQPKQLKQKKPLKKVGRLKDIVEQEMYDSWLQMLGALVPDGRTHRISVVVAGMLHYALAEGGPGEENEGADLLEALESVLDGREENDIVLDAVKILFKDARVKFERKSRSGQKYSIAEESVREFISWDLYSWE